MKSRSFHSDGEERSRSYQPRLVCTRWMSSVVVSRGVRWCRMTAMGVWVRQGQDEDEDGVAIPDDEEVVNGVEWRQQQHPL